MERSLPPGDDWTQHAEHYFRTLFEALPVAVYTTDINGRLTFYNQAAVDLWGQRPPLGETSWCGSWRLYRSDGAPLPYDQCPMAIAIREARPVRGIEVVAERPDGTRIPILPFPTPLYDVNGRMIGAINTLVDMSGRYQSVLELREREDHYRHSVDLNPQLLWVSDADGHVVDVGERWTLGTGMERSQALGDGWLDVCHPDDVGRVKNAIYQSILKGRSYDVEHRFRTADGHYRWVHSRAFPRRDNSGQIVCWYGATEDVDSRARAEIRRNQLEVELRHATRLSALGQMAGTLAHELSQPLAAAVNYLDGCDSMIARVDTSVSAKVRLGLKRARRQIEHAAEVVSRLRQFVRKQVPEEQPADLNRIVTDAVQLATAGNADRLGIALDLALDQSGPMISADPIEIQQVVLNLVRNAIEAMETMETRDLRVATTTETAVAIVTVSDTGTGLAVAPTEMFEPFLTTKSRGLGLGLPICRRIIERYGGRISAAPNDAGGATFHVRLPLLTDD